MDTTIVVAIITVVGGGLFVLLQKFVDRRFSRAKEQVEKNSATVADMLNVVEGFKDLNEQYRIRNEQLENYNKDLLVENVRLKEKMDNASADL